MIASEDEYLAALKLVEAYFDQPEEPDPSSSEGVRLEALIAQIEVYEAKHYPI